MKFNIGDTFYIAVKQDSEACEIFKGVICSYCYQIGDGDPRFWYYSCLIFNTYEFMGEKDSWIDKEESSFHDKDYNSTVHTYDKYTNTLQMSFFKYAEEDMHETIEKAEEQVKKIAKQEWGE